MPTGVSAFPARDTTDPRATRVTERLYIQKNNCTRVCKASKSSSMCEYVGTGPRTDAIEDFERIRMVRFGFSESKFQIHGGGCPNSRPRFDYRMAISFDRRTKSHWGFPLYLIPSVKLVGLMGFFVAEVCVCPRSKKDDGGYPLSNIRYVDYLAPTPPSGMCG